METVEDLFDELNLADNTDTTTISELNKGDPAQVIENDRKNEKTITSSTEKLRNRLTVCEDIVIAAFNLRQFVPNLDSTSNEKNKFWKEMVIPNMVKVLTQDLKARYTLTHAFGAVRDLGIVIQKASEIVRDTKGSPKAIEIAKKKIPAALAKLDEYIVKAENLESSAINAFTKDAATLFEIMGPKAADFVERRLEIKNALYALYDEQNRLYDTHEENRAMADSFSYLINATQKRLENEEAASVAIKTRITELNQLNKSTEEKIQEIEGLVTDIVTTKTRKKYLFWRQNKRTVVTERSPNEDREDNKKYYESLIIARMARIREEQTNDDATKKNWEGLVDLQAEYKRKYQLALQKMQNFNETVTEKMNDIRKQIESLYKKLDELDVEQSTVENKIGLSGNTLFECLANVQAYSRLINTGASAYSPLVSILNGIKSMVETDVELLSGSNIDIFTAGTRLTKMVGFIADYNVTTLSMLELRSELPDEYRQHQQSINN